MLQHAVTQLEQRGASHNRPLTFKRTMWLRPGLSIVHCQQTLSKQKANQQPNRELENTVSNCHLIEATNFLTSEAQDIHIWMEVDVKPGHVEASLSAFDCVYSP